MPDLAWRDLLASGLDLVPSGYLGLPCATANCMARVSEITVTATPTSLESRRLVLRCDVGHVSEVVEPVWSPVGGVDA